MTRGLPSSQRTNWLPFSGSRLSECGATKAMSLFCFPYAGVGAAIFRDWRDQLPTSLEVLPVELPGNGSRCSEPLLRHVTELAAAAAEALEPFCRGSYCFFGHSLGALLAFETARILISRGCRPRHLFFSASRAPQVSPLQPEVHLLPSEMLHERLRERRSEERRVGKECRSRWS